MSKLIRFSVVGAGHMGAHHIRKLIAIGPRLGARISAIVEPDELRAQAVLREFPLAQRPKVVSNIGELGSLGPEDLPDAAIIAVPASIHVEATMACLGRGLHCLVEKPLGFSALDVKELEAKAVSVSRVLQVGLLERWTLFHLWENWRPKNGQWTLSAVRSGPFVPRAADTDVIHDLMIHDIDLCVLLDQVFQLPRVKNIRAWGRKLRSNLLDVASVELELADDSRLKFFASRLSAESSRSWELTGPNWHATIDFMRRSLKRFERVGRDLNSFEAKEQLWPSGDPLGLELEAFVDRIRGAVPSGQADKLFCPMPSLLPTPLNVLRTHEIIDEILSSIKILDA